MALKNTFFTAAILLNGLFCSVSWADDVADLSAKLQALNTFSAHFEQRLLDDSGAELQKTEGLVKVSNPGRFFWQVEPPFEQTVVTDGEQLWVYDPDMEQVTVYSKQQLASTPAQLLSGDFAELAKTYTITASINASINKGALTYRMAPKNEQTSNFSGLEFVFDKKDRLAGMTLEDKLGQRTVVTFSKRQFNKPIDATIFSFKPPAGTDVIHSGS
ncbi:outer membrane lipoprotein chaperone LolA [Teredinibacter turnerae]|uniref:outer membrane lipoprotein chaperone LolA n=1 Tax=Teredinibacter turnerae TaxID=2426 RepID=UPI0005F890A5|nr:outer membrane lipoprotein chaperone LolA [Teredinibacter turnerae]